MKHAEASAALLQFARVGYRLSAVTVQPHAVMML